MDRDNLRLLHRRRVAEIKSAIKAATSNHNPEPWETPQDKHAGEKNLRTIVFAFFLEQVAPNRPHNELDSFIQRIARLAASLAEPNSVFKRGGDEVAGAVSYAMLHSQLQPRDPKMNETGWINIFKIASVRVNKIRKAKKVGMNDGISEGYATEIRKHWKLKVPDPHY
jgi:hypothetical protein